MLVPAGAFTPWMDRRTAGPSVALSGSLRIALAASGESCSVTVAGVEPRMGPPGAASTLIGSAAAAGTAENARRPGPRARVNSRTERRESIETLLEDAFRR